MCWLLPEFLHLGPAWLISGRVAAWVLFTVGTAGVLIELDNERQGFGELAVAAVCAFCGLGLLALATELLHGVVAAVLGVTGTLFLIATLIASGIGTGKLLSPPTPQAADLESVQRGRQHNSAGAPTSSDASGRTSRLSRGELFALILSGVQAILAALALFWRH